jgi:dienelactone hydrolase
MKWLCQIAAITIIFANLPAAKAEEAGSKDFAVRTELHQIATLTLSDRQFLEGDANAKPVTITAELRIAQGSGRLPVVVLEHGSGGLSANVEFWARELNEQGISTFALDGFTGRGLTEVATNQASLGRLNFILDLYRSLEVLAKHPRVDPTRIAVMGFSRGGQAALYASLSRFQHLWNKSGVEFAAYLPFYPDCRTTFIGDTEVVSRPIRIFGGTPDDFNPIAACKAYVERLKSAGHDVALTEYPNAPHGFDNPLGAQPAMLSPRSQSVRHCTIREETMGTLINVDTRQPFSYEDSCVERGAHLGADPAAAEAARTAVTAFLRATFKLD